MRHICLSIWISLVQPTLHNLISIHELFMNILIVVADFDLLQILEIARHAELHDCLDHDDAIQIGRKTVQTCGDGRNGNRVSADADSGHKNVENAALK